MKYNDFIVTMLTAITMVTAISACIYGNAFYDPGFALELIKVFSE